MQEAVRDRGDFVWTESSVSLSLVPSIADFRYVEPFFFTHIRESSLGGGEGRGEEGRGGKGEGGKGE